MRFNIGKKIIFALCLVLLGGTLGALVGLGLKVVCIHGYVLEQLSLTENKAKIRSIKGTQYSNIEGYLVGYCDMFSEQEEKVHTNVNEIKKIIPTNGEWEVCEWNQIEMQFADCYTEIGEIYNYLKASKQDYFIDVNEKEREKCFDVIKTKLNENEELQKIYSIAERVRCISEHIKEMKKFLENHSTEWTYGEVFEVDGAKKRKVLYDENAEGYAEYKKRQEIIDGYYKTCF